MLLLVMLVAISSLVACGTVPTPKRSMLASSTCPTPEGDDYFFPPGALIPQDEASDLQQRRGLSEYYRTAGVTSLSCGPADGFRVFWGGGYGNHSVVVTVTADAITTSQFAPPNVQTQTVARRSTIPTTPSVIKTLSDRLDESSFWQTAPFKELEGEGTVWVIEARQGSSYKAVTRVAPDSQLTRVAMSILELSDLPVPNELRKLRP